MPKPANLEYAFPLTDSSGSPMVIVAYRVIETAYSGSYSEFDVTLTPGEDFEHTPGDGDGSVGQYVLFERDSGSDVGYYSKDSGWVATAEEAWGFDPFDPANHTPTTVRYWELQPGSDVMATTLGVLPKILSGTGDNNGYDVHAGLVTYDGVGSATHSEPNAYWFLAPADTPMTETGLFSAQPVSSPPAGVYLAIRTSENGPSAPAYQPPLAFPAGWTPGNTTGSGPLLPYLGEAFGLDIYAGLVLVAEDAPPAGDEWGRFDPTTPLTADGIANATMDAVGSLRLAAYLVVAGSPAPTAFPEGWTFRPYGIGPVVITDENAGGVIGDIAYIVSGYAYNASNWLRMLIDAIPDTKRATFADLGTTLTIASGEVLYADEPGHSIVFQIGSDPRTFPDIVAVRFPAGGTVAVSTREAAPGHPLLVAPAGLAGGAWDGDGSYQFTFEFSSTTTDISTFGNAPLLPALGDRDVYLIAGPTSQSGNPPLSLQASDFPLSAETSTAAHVWLSSREQGWLLASSFVQFVFGPGTTNIDQDALDSWYGDMAALFPGLASDIASIASANGPGGPGAPANGNLRLDAVTADGALHLTLLTGDEVNLGAGLVEPPDYVWPYIERYDLRTKTWLPRVPLPSVRAGLPASGGTVPPEAETPVQHGSDVGVTDSSLDYAWQEIGEWTGGWLYPPDDLPVALGTYSSWGYGVQTSNGLILIYKTSTGVTTGFVEIPASGTLLRYRYDTVPGGDLPPMAVIGKNPEVTPASYAAEGGFAGIIDGKLYFGGGDGDNITGTEFFVFDPTTEECIRLPDATNTRGWYPDYCPYGVAGGNLWVYLGNSDGPVEGIVFDPVAGAWSEFALVSGNFPVDQVQGVEIGGKLYFVYDAVYVFDPVALTVEAKAQTPFSFNTPPASVAIDGKIQTPAKDQDWASDPVGPQTKQVTYDPVTDTFTIDDVLDVPNVSYSTTWAYRNVQYATSGWAVPDGPGSRYVAGVVGLTGNAPLPTGPAVVGGSLAAVGGTLTLVGGG